METLTEKTHRVKGRGIADPESEPTYPMKNNTGDDHNRRDNEKPKQKRKNIEVLHSNERPKITSDFGTPAPLSGLSGIIRRLAFRYRESSFGHWFPLIFADRINIWEGFLNDFKRGFIPSIFAKRGWKAERKYNKKQFITTTAVKVLATTFVFAWMMTRGSRKKRRALKKG